MVFGITWLPEFAPWKTGFLVVLAILINREYTLMGFTHDPDTLIDKHFEGFECNNLVIGQGGEDISTTTSGLAFTTFGLYYPPILNDKKIGKIYISDLNQSPVTVKELVIVAGNGLKINDLKLNPHGSSILEVDGKTYLYVVNHQTDLAFDRIEKFEYDFQSNQIIWLKSVSHAALRSINDIIVISEDEFYATNDFYFSHQYPTLRTLEVNLCFRLGSIAYCNKKGDCSIKHGFNQIEKGIGKGMPNGITARGFYNEDKKVYTYELLVVYSFQSGIGVFNIGRNGDLEYSWTIPGPSLMDNTWTAPDGSIYITGTAQLWKMLYGLITGNTNYMAGTEIFRLEPTGYELQQVYFDNGSQFQAGSVAVVLDNNVLIGSPAGNFMECHKIDTFNDIIVNFENTADSDEEDLGPEDDSISYGNSETDADDISEEIMDDISEPVSEKIFEVIFYEDSEGINEKSPEESTKEHSEEATENTSKEKYEINSDSA